jgi:hypothetical protein
MAACSAGSTVDVTSSVDAATDVAAGEQDAVANDAVAAEAGADAVANDAIAADAGAADSGVGGDAGGDSGGNAGVLGSVWKEVEANGRCHGVWIRVNGTSNFTASWADCNVTALLAMSLDAGQVAISRTNSSDGNDCQYQGTISGQAASGTYTCAKQGIGTWTAAITP